MVMVNESAKDAKLKNAEFLKKLYQTWLDRNALAFSSFFVLTITKNPLDGCSKDTPRCTIKADNQMNQLAYLSSRLHCRQPNARKGFSLGKFPENYYVKK